MTSAVKLGGREFPQKEKRMGEIKILERLHLNKSIHRKQGWNNGLCTKDPSASQQALSQEEVWYTPEAEGISPLGQCSCG